MAKKMMDIGVKSIMSGGEEVGIDLLVVNGDFEVVESSDRHGQELILGAKGDFKGNPTICVDAETFDDEVGKNRLMNAISTEYQRDGVDVQQVEIVNGKLVVRGYYK